MAFIKNIKNYIYYQSTQNYKNLITIETTFKTLAKVCRAEAWTFVSRKLSSKLYKRSIIPFDD